MHENARRLRINILLRITFHVLFKLVLMRHMQIQEHRIKLIRFFWKLTKGIWKWWPIYFYGYSSSMGVQIQCKYRDHPRIHQFREFQSDLSPPKLFVTVIKIITWNLVLLNALLFFIPFGIVMPFTRLKGFGTPQRLSITSFALHLGCFITM